MPDSDLERVLRTCDEWPVPHVSAGITDSRDTLALHGDPHVVYRLASLSKVITAWTCLVAVEEGSISLDDPLGPSGSTLRHCLAHAAGFGFDGDQPITGVARRRIYSNTGIELAVRHLENRTGIEFAQYMNDAILEPLHLESTYLNGSPAHGFHSTLADTLVFTRELLAPRLIARSTAEEAFTIQFPTLSGLVPGIGSFDPNPWGLGIEIRGSKHPHWMGTRTSPRTVGHFGGAGTMFWIDPTIDLGLVALTDRPFDEWASDAVARWSELSDRVIETRTSRSS